MSVGADVVDGWFLVGLDTSEIVVTDTLDVRRKDNEDDDGGYPVTAKPQNEAGADMSLNVDLVADEYVSKQITLTRKREHWVLEMKRRVVGLHSFGSALGAYATTFGFSTGPNSSGLWGTGTKKMRCTRDVLVATNEAVGEYEESQTWEYWGKWRNIDPVKSGQT